MPFSVFSFLYIWNIWKCISEGKVIWNASMSTKGILRQYATYNSHICIERLHILMLPLFYPQYLVLKASKLPSLGIHFFGKITQCLSCAHEMVRKCVHRQFHAALWENEWDSYLLQNKRSAGISSFGKSEMKITMIWKSQRLILHHKRWWGLFFLPTNHSVLLLNSHKIAIIKLRCILGLLKN